jgi:hypothetical protein
MCFHILICNITNHFGFVLGEIYFIQQDCQSCGIFLYNISSLSSLPGKLCMTCYVSATGVQTSKQNVFISLVPTVVPLLLMNLLGVIQVGTCRIMQKRCCC